MPVKARPALTSEAYDCTICEEKEAGKNRGSSASSYTCARHLRIRTVANDHQSVV
jgi:hypothetical protein